jgi:hypothetical protein
MPTRVVAVRNTRRFAHRRPSFACTLDDAGQALSMRHGEGRAAL